MRTLERVLFGDKVTGGPRGWLGVGDVPTVCGRLLLAIGDRAFFSRETAGRYDTSVSVAVSLPRTGLPRAPRPGTVYSTRAASGTIVHVGGSSTNPSSSARATYESHPSAVAAAQRMTHTRSSPSGSLTPRMPMALRWISSCSYSRSAWSADILVFKTRRTKRFFGSFRISSQ